MNLFVPGDDRVRIKESEKRGKYWDPARELKKLWNMELIVISIIIGVLGTFSEGSERRLKNLENG